MKTVKFGVIGVKGIGGTHIKGILSAEGAELLAVADIDEEAGRSAASDHDAKWYRNYEDILELDELDAVTICTPHFLHYPMAMIDRSIDRPSQRTESKYAERKESSYTKMEKPDARYQANP